MYPKLNSTLQLMQLVKCLYLSTKKLWLYFPWNYSDSNHFMASEAVGNLDIFFSREIERQLGAVGSMKLDRKVYVFLFK